MKAKRFDDAVTAFKRATEIATAKPNYWNNLAAAYREVGKFELALAALDSNLKLAAPHGDWIDWHNLGTAYRNLGFEWGNDRDRHSKAATAFRQSLQLNPRNGEGWNSLATVYQVLGNYPEALRSYKKAEALGVPYARKNHDHLQAALAAQARSGGDSPSSSSSSSSGGSSSSPSGGGCSYSSYAACNAEKAGDRWAADRIDRGTASGSEKDWYGR